MQADTRQVYEGEMTAKQRQELRDAKSVVIIRTNG